jgi:tyrosyl-tRNA synthetase
MFRKVMGISDALMWRYWELLTDATLPEIAAMKAREPMEVKMELAARIVADFHSTAEATQAGEDFNREVRQGGEPADIETMEYAPTGTFETNHDGAGRVIRVPHLLQTIGLAATRSEAERLIKAGAVEIDGMRRLGMSFQAEAGTYTIRAGKKWKKITVPA